MKTTLAAIREHSPCADGWAKLLRHLGKTSADAEPLMLLTILESNGLDDALWCLRAVDGHKREIRLLAAWADARAAAGTAAGAAAWADARDAQQRELERVLSSISAGVDPYPAQEYAA